MKGLTISDRTGGSDEDAEGLALRALGWILSEQQRAQRFLDLTGLTPEGLRASLAEPGTQVAVFDFLASHEPDLTAAAEALDVDPAQFAAARDRLAK
jgi:hypothetical protein